MGPWLTKLHWPYWRGGLLATVHWLLWRRWALAPLAQVALLAWMGSCLLAPHWPYWREMGSWLLAHWPYWRGGSWLLAHWPCSVNWWAPGYWLLAYRRGGPCSTVTGLFGVDGLLTTDKTDYWRGWAPIYYPLFLVDESVPLFISGV
jgi:hypothetical protein